MADHPEAEQSTTSAPVADRTSALNIDRTSTLVSCGLVLLAVLGVVTVFSDAIGAAWSPNASGAAATVTATASAPSPAPAAIAGDGGPA